MKGLNILVIFVIGVSNFNGILSQVSGDSTTPPTTTPPTTTPPTTTPPTTTLPTTTPPTATPPTTTPPTTTPPTTTPPTTTPPTTTPPTTTPPTTTPLTTTPPTTTPPTTTPPTTTPPTTTPPTTTPPTTTPPTTTPPTTTPPTTTPPTTTPPTTTPPTTTPPTTTPPTTRPSTTTPTTTTVDPRCKSPSNRCYKNTNGMCRRFDTPCDAEISKNSLGAVIVWKVTSDLDCARRIGDEVKVCQTNCNMYIQGSCHPSGPSVCGYSKVHRQCRLFSNLCTLKQDACRYPGTKDWRVAQKIRCSGLRINGPAKTC